MARIARIQPCGRFPIVDVNYTIVNGYISFNFFGDTHRININNGITGDTRYRYTYNDCHVWFIGEDRDSDPDAFFVRISIFDF